MDSKVPLFRLEISRAHSSCNFARARRRASLSDMPAARFSRISSCAASGRSVTGVGVDAAREETEVESRAVVELVNGLFCVSCKDGRRILRGFFEDLSRHCSEGCERPGDRRGARRNISNLGIVMASSVCSGRITDLGLGTVNTKKDSKKVLKQSVTGSYGPSIERPPG